MDANRNSFVVGVDASQESNLALDWARSLAGPNDRIVVVHAWEVPLVTGYDMVVTIDPGEIGQLSLQGLTELIGRVGDDRLEPITHQGHAGRALVTLADDYDAAAIVVGHRGDSRVSMMLGSTANYVLHHTERPVVVVRGEQVDVPKRVVVGVDDNDLDGEGAENESTRALRWAYALSGAEQIRVVHSWFLPALAVGMFATVAAETESMDTAAKLVVDRVLMSAGPPPEHLEVIGEAVRGTPGFALIEASRDADLIVVGSRGRGGFKGLLLGSTSAEVACHSHTPVAVIR